MSQVGGCEAMIFYAPNNLIAHLINVADEDTKQRRQATTLSPITTISRHFVGSLQASHHRADVLPPTVLVL